MATTTTVDLSTLIPAVVNSDTLEAYYAATTFANYAEQKRDLAGARPGDRIKIGSFTGSTPALNLTETEAIVPKKFAATAREFVVGRIGDGYEYSYASNRFAVDDLQARSTLYLGQAAAQRVDLNLASAALSSVLAPRKITATGTDTAAVLTPANFIAAVRTFPDEQLGQLVAVLTGGQRNQLTDAVLAAGTQYAGQTVWAQGAISTFYGVPIETNTRLATTTGARKAAVFLLRNRTLASAFATDPLIEFERHANTATVDAYMNAWWAGGVQDLDTLTVIDAAG